MEASVERHHAAVAAGTRAAPNTSVAYDSVHGLRKLELTHEIEHSPESLATLAETFDKSTRSPAQCIEVLGLQAHPEAREYMRDDGRMGNIPHDVAADIIYRNDATTQMMPLPNFVPPPTQPPQPPPHGQHGEGDRGAVKMEPSPDHSYSPEPMGDDDDSGIIGDGNFAAGDGGGICDEELDPFAHFNAPAMSDDAVPTTPIPTPMDEPADDALAPSPMDELSCDVPVPSPMDEEFAAIPLNGDVNMVGLLEPVPPTTDAAAGAATPQALEEGAATPPEWPPCPPPPVADAVGSGVAPPVQLDDDTMFRDSLVPPPAPMPDQEYIPTSPHDDDANEEEGAGLVRAIGDALCAIAPAAEAVAELARVESGSLAWKTAIELAVKSGLKHHPLNAASDLQVATKMKYGMDHLKSHIGAERFYSFNSQDVSGRFKSLSSALEMPMALTPELAHELNSYAGGSAVVALMDMKVNGIVPQFDADSGMGSRGLLEMESATDLGADGSIHLMDKHNQEMRHSFFKVVEQNASLIRGQGGDLGHVLNHKEVVVGRIPVLAFSRQGGNQSIFVYADHREKADLSLMAPSDDLMLRLFRWHHEPEKYYWLPAADVPKDVVVNALPVIKTLVEMRAYTNTDVYFTTSEATDKASVDALLALEGFGIVSESNGRRNRMRLKGPGEISSWQLQAEWASQMDPVSRLADPKYERLSMNC